MSKMVREYSTHGRYEKITENATQKSHGAMAFIEFRMCASQNNVI
jgi:hypothetical protein